MSTMTRDAGTRPPSGTALAEAIRLGCEGHVATSDGTFAPAPDRQAARPAARANVRPERPLTTTDRRRPMMDRYQGERAIGKTRGNEALGENRSPGWWSHGSQGRRQPEPTTALAGRGPGTNPEKAKGRRANADRTACLAERSRCAELQRLRVLMS